MIKTHHDLLLADDDVDDYTFFEDALEELPISTTLTIVNDGVELMNFLSTKSHNLPGILFPDLNMPRKSGFECLSEIKMTGTLKNVPVDVFSTSLNIEVVDLLYQKGARYYIRKPQEYDKLKKVILEAILLTSENESIQPSRDKFILHS